MTVCTENRLKTITCKLKGVITQENGIVLTRNNLELIIYASNYYCFQTNMQTWVLQIGQDKKFPGFLRNSIKLCINPFRKPIYEIFLYHGSFPGYGFFSEFGSSTSYTVYCKIIVVRK